MLPEIGKTYNFYDDGKITFSRQYKCVITDIIPYDDVSDTIKEQHKTITTWYNWLFAPKTDYFIIGRVIDDVVEDQVFMRTLKNTWFSNAVELTIKDFNFIERLDVGGLLD